MTQLEKVSQDVNLIQYGLSKLNNSIQDFHSINELIVNLQNEQIDLFNEFTLKFKELREEFLENLDGLGMFIKEDYDYINSVIQLVDSKE